MKFTLIELERRVLILEDKILDCDNNSGKKYFEDIKKNTIYQISELNYKIEFIEELHTMLHGQFSSDESTSDSSSSTPAFLIFDTSSTTTSYTDTFDSSSDFSF